MSKSFRKVSHLRAKYGKSPQIFLSICIPRQYKFWLNVLIWSIYLGLMKTTRWDLCNDMYFIWVYCFGSIRMTSCLWVPRPLWDAKELLIWNLNWWISLEKRTSFLKCLGKSEARIVRKIWPNTRPLMVIWTNMDLVRVRINPLMIFSRSSE